MKIGVLGLGRMGAPIAAALAERHDVSAYDPDPSRTGDARRIRRAPSLLDAADGAEVVITVLPGAAEFGDNLVGIADALSAGSLWIDCTTNDPRLADDASTRAADRSAAFVGAPITGDPSQAHAGGLHFSLSGPSHAVARAAAILAPLTDGSPPTIVGDGAGDAHTLKLLSNLLWFGQVVAVTEAVLLGARRGIPADRLVALLADGPGSSVLLARDYEAVLRGDYRETFGVDRVVEELDVLTSMAAGTGVPFDLSRLVTDIHQRALQRYGPVDGELLAAALLKEEGRGDQPV